MWNDEYSPTRDLERLADFYAKYGYTERAREIRSNLRRLRQRDPELTGSSMMDERMDLDHEAST